MSTFNSSSTTDSPDVEALRQQLAAVERSMAVIEFDLDGTIRRANENFCEAMGYAEHELVGRHHRLFVERAFAESAEYASFWRRLDAGEFMSGEYRRFGKGGREVWIQATYNPVFDDSGRPCKIVKFASDVTAQRRTLDVAIAALRDMTIGILPEHIEGDFEGDYAQLVDRINALSRAEGQVVDVMHAISQGDLTRDVTPRSEHDELMLAIREMTSAVNDSLRSIRSELASASGTSTQVADSAQDVAEQSTRSAASLQKLHASVEHLTIQTKASAESASDALSQSERASSLSDQGNDYMRSMTNSMDEIHVAAQSISNIIRVIDEIAFQTNLLALNAAVEAARAGTHGKGFAVVAEEVRNLAGRSAKAAKETADLIHDTSRKVERGLEIASSTSVAFSEIRAGVDDLSQLMKQVASMSDEQARSITEINIGLEQLDHSTQRNSANAQEMAASAVHLEQQVREMMAAVGEFDLREPGAEARGELTPELMEQFQAFLSQMGMQGVLNQH